MKVLENIWNWIDLYAWTLVAIALIILSIIFIVCEISLTVSQKKQKIKPKLYLPLDKPNEHDKIAQMMNSPYMIFRGCRENGKSNIMFPTPIGCEKDKKVCKKCVNCKYFGCLCNNSYFTEHPNRFNKCKDFEEKE